MPSPPWTTPDQDEFLNSRLPDFLAAQRNKTTTDFWKIIYRDFFDKWADPQDEIAAVIVPKKRKAKGRPLVPENQTHSEWVKLRKQQIYNWFNNQESGATQVRRPSTQISLCGASQSSQRLLSEINLYSKKYYDTRVRDLAAEAWKVAQEDPARPSRILVINKCITECWFNESEEIKQEIRQDYEAQRSRPIPSTASPTPTAESYAAAQGELPPQVRDFIEQAAKRTGFCFTVLAGGPDPNRPGRMRILAFHQGVNRYGQKFGTSYASFNENVTEPFQKFLYQSFSGEELDGHVESETENPVDVKTNDMEPPCKKQKTDDNTPRPSSGTPSTPNPPPPPAEVTNPIPSSPLTNVALPPPNPPPPPAEVTTPIPSSPLNAAPPPPPATPSTPIPPPPAAEVTTESQTSGRSAPCNVLQGSSSTLQLPYRQVQSNATYLPCDQVPNPYHPFSYEEFDAVLKAMALEGNGSGEMEDMEGLDSTVNPWELPHATTLYYRQNTNLFTPQAYSLPGTVYPATATPMSTLPHSTSTPLAPAGHGTITTPMPIAPSTSLAPAGHGTITAPIVTPVTPSTTLAPANHGTITTPVAPSTTLAPANHGPITTPIVTPVAPFAPSSSPTTLAPAGHGQAITTPIFTPIAPSSSPTTLSPAGRTITTPVAPSTTLAPAGHGPITTPIFTPIAPSSSPTTLSPAGPGTSTAPIEPGFESSSSTEIRPPPSERRVIKGPLSDINLNTTNVSQRTNLEGAPTMDERPSRTRKPPMSKEVQPNVWLDLAHGYLVKDIDDASWTSCIEKWFEFEKQTINDLDVNSRRIPAKGRPVILSKWLPTRNYTAIPKLNDEAQAAFATEWLHWWNKIQPKWRKASNGSSLPCSVDTASGKDDLSGIKKFGPTGLVMVLIGLKWWAGTRGKDGLWELAVADLLGCFGSFSQSTESPSRRKRAPATT